MSAAYLAPQALGLRDVRAGAAQFEDNAGGDGPEHEVVRNGAVPGVAPRSRSLSSPRMHGRSPLSRRSRAAPNRQLSVSPSPKHHNGVVQPRRLQRLPVTRADGITRHSRKRLRSRSCPHPPTTTVASAGHGSLAAAGPSVGPAHRPLYPATKALAPSAAQFHDAEQQQRMWYPPLDSAAAAAPAAAPAAAATERGASQGPPTSRVLTPSGIEFEPKSAGASPAPKSGRRARARRAGSKGTSVAPLVLPNGVLQAPQSVLATPVLASPPGSRPLTPTKALPSIGSARPAAEALPPACADGLDCADEPPAGTLTFKKQTSCPDWDSVSHFDDEIELGLGAVRPADPTKAAVPPQLADQATQQTETLASIGVLRQHRRSSSGWVAAAEAAPAFGTQRSCPDWDDTSAFGPPLEAGELVRPMSAADSFGSFEWASEEADGFDGSDEANTGSDGNDADTSSDGDDAGDTGSECSDSGPEWGPAAEELSEGNVDAGQYPRSGLYTIDEGLVLAALLDEIAEEYARSWLKQSNMTTAQLQLAFGQGARSDQARRRQSRLHRNRHRRNSAGKRQAARRVSSLLREDKPPSPTVGYIQQFSLLSASRRAHYERMYALYEESDTGLCYDQLVLCMQGLCQHQLSVAEVEYILRALDLLAEGDRVPAVMPRADGTPTAGRPNLTVGLDHFVVIAAFAEQVARQPQLIKDTIAELDLSQMTAQIARSRELFFLCTPDEFGQISADDFEMALCAGRLTAADAERITSMLCASDTAVDGAADANSMSFLAFLSYIPLFINVHQDISNNPIRQQSLSTRRPSWTANLSAIARAKNTSNLWLQKARAKQPLSCDVSLAAIARANKVGGTWLEQARARNQDGKSMYLASVFDEVRNEVRARNALNRASSSKQ